MACETLSKYYPIVKKFSEYFLLYDDTSTIDFGPDCSISFTVHGPEVGHNESDCASVCTCDRILQGVTATCCSITWRLLFPKWDNSESGTLPECKMALSTRFFAILVYVKKKNKKKHWCRKISWCSQNGTDVLKRDIPRMPYVLGPRLFVHPILRNKYPDHTKKMPEANVPKLGHGSKMGQYEFDCACVSVVLVCIPLVFHRPYIKPVGHGSIGLLQARFFFIIKKDLFFLLLFSNPLFQIH